MESLALQRPLLPTHYLLRVDPPDEAGDEALHIVSGRLSLKLKGQAFREFQSRVVPLLDGRHTLAEIQAATEDVFRPDDLSACLKLLQTQGILVDGESSGGAALPDAEVARLTPQLNFFRDLAPGRDLQNSLASATVAVVGLGGAGSALALALAAAGVGHLICVDPLPVSVSDAYLTPFFGLAQVGRPRAEALREAVSKAAPRTAYRPVIAPLHAEDELRAAVAGAGFLACCLDAAQANLAYKLNRICLAEKTPWISCALSGAEIVVGPGITPGKGPCYLCYRMRAIACAGNPEEAFALEKFLDRRNRDDSAERENLVFGAALAANFMGLEIVKALTALAESTLTGRILTIRLTDLAIERHTVLRKPWCPACSTANLGQAREGV